MLCFVPDKMVSEQSCLNTASSSDPCNGGNESNPSSTDKDRSPSSRENVRLSGDVSVRFGAVQSRRSGLENLHV